MKLGVPSHMWVEQALDVCLWGMPTKVRQPDEVVRSCCFVCLLE